MEVGQVSYHDKTKVKRMRVEKDNAIVNNLNRTKEVTLVMTLIALNLPSEIITVYWTALSEICIRNRLFY
jgi:hypothetical protein